MEFFLSEGELEHLEIFLHINHFITETFNGNFFGKWCISVT